MLFKLKYKDIKIYLLSAIFVFMTSCIQTEIPVDNSLGNPDGAKSAPVGYAQLLRTNPIIKSGNSRLSANSNLNTYLSGAYVYIAPPGYLQYSCGATFNFPEYPEEIYGQADNCIQMVNNTNEAIESLSSTWSYNTGAENFLHVNTFALARENINLFYDILIDAHFNHHFNQVAKVYPSSIPINPISPFSLWRTKEFIEGEPAVPTTLKIKAACDAPDIASFNPSLYEICLGYDSVETKLKFAHDPSVVYHELGHLYIDIMLNLRNAEHSFKSELGTLFYEEAGVIGEGVADYFSYVTNQRKHIGEWALGRYLNQSRPMTESDPLHIEILKNAENGQKLAYPEYINYDPNQPEKVKEDVHYGGQIVGHYLVSLTDQLKNACGMNHKQATTTVVSVLAETFAELGDLTGTVSDYLVLDRTSDDPDVIPSYYINLNDSFSSQWQQIVNPINFRRFFQHFAKHALYTISYNKCPTFNKDYLEQHLDDYGLLLFETYNDNLNSSTGEVSITDLPDAIANSDIEAIFADFELAANYIFAFGSLATDAREDELTVVNEVNRKNTVLISKSLISLPDENDITRKQAFVFDSRNDVEKALKNLKFQGEAINLTNGIAGYEYNNGNGSISPGEVVGVMLNLINNSNSPMGGVQLLANDWDHFKFQDADPTTVPLPCRINNWPIPSEGAASADADPSEPELGDCAYTTRNNGVSEIEDEEPLDIVVPSCLVQLRENNETRWVSQDVMRKHLMIQDNECLNNDAEKNAYRNQECLLRILPAASHSFMSKIDPQKTYAESLKSQDGTIRPINSSAAVFMEVNKFIPPGTVFVCRFRVRFNNCKDCFSNIDNGNDDFLQYEYSGAKPFKVVNFKFMVID